MIFSFVDFSSARIREPEKYFNVPARPWNIEPGEYVKIAIAESLGEGEPLVYRGAFWVRVDEIRPMVGFSASVDDIVDGFEIGQSLQLIPFSAISEISSRSRFI